MDMCNHNKESWGLKMGRIKLAIIVLLVSMVVVPVFVACTQEKIVEVPVEKVVEKEVVKEVPVEKVVIKEVPVETGTIVLGMMGDFTGPYAVAATPMLKAAQDYVRYINEEGGINGNMLKLVWGEHGFAPPKMLTLYDKFMEDGAIQVSNMTVLESSVTKARHDEDKIPCTSAGVNTDMVANPAFQYSLIPIRVDQIGALAD